MLKGEGFDFAVEGFPDLDAGIRTNLSALRTYMATYPVSGIFPPSSGIGKDFPPAALYVDFMSRSDNNHVKLQASLCLLSLAIFEETGAAKDFTPARTRFLQTLDNMTITYDKQPVGGWAEGPNYHLYTMREYLPALTALQNHGLFDYISYPEFMNTHLLLPRMVMPDGYLPPFDGNEATIFDMAPLLASRHRDRPESEALLWLWDRNGRPANKAFLADLLAQFDDTPPAHADPAAMGWTRSESRYGTGFAAFRSSWEKDALYLFLLAEHGEARTKGQAHEHPDPNSFLLNAFGEMLMLDSGYGGFDQKDATRFAVNHNLILVDGAGPAGAQQQDIFGLKGFWVAGPDDAFLTRFFSAERLDFAVSRTSYLASDFTRHVLFADRRYFILFDRISNNLGIRTYTLLLHGNGGGTSGGSFTLLPDGARWNRKKASIRALCTGTNDVTLGPAALAFETQDLAHAVYKRSPMESHTVLKASQRCTGSQFLTLLFPERAGLSMPGMETISVTPGERGTGLRLALGDTVDVCVVKQRGDTLSFVEKGTAFTTNADLAWSRILPDGAPGAYFMLNGTSFSGTRGMSVSLSVKGSLFADMPDPSHITGYIQTGAPNTITLRGVQLAKVTFRGNEIPFTVIPGGISFGVTGDGDWSAEAGLLPPSNLRAEDVPNDHGHHLRLTWSPSPSEQGGLVNWYRICRSRSPELTDPLPLSRFTSLDSLLFYEERYTILVDSVAAGKSEFTDPFVPLNGSLYYYWVQAVGRFAVSKLVPLSGTVRVEVRTPLEFRLGPARPNPFNPSTTLSFTLPERVRATLTVYDILGRKAGVLLDGIFDPGEHSVRWDARGFPSGVYFYTLKAGNNSGTGRAALVR
ncbi:MAG: T9SS type A sorting domain-containing protein, partial [Candidatus Nanopelagicales bacterium]